MRCSGLNMLEHFIPSVLGDHMHSAHSVLFVGTYDEIVELYRDFVRMSPIKQEPRNSLLYY